jgi:hypothetical protein
VYRKLYLSYRRVDGYVVGCNIGMLINCIVAVNYEFENGSTLGNNPLIIKDMNNTVTVTAELRTFYDLGNLAQPLHDDLYLKGTSRYKFIAEYQYVIKTLTLHPCIVEPPEKNVVDRVILKSESDYVMNYGMGILTIKMEAL